MIFATSSGKRMPATRAASGTRLIAVIPGRVLTSRTTGPLAPTMKSMRETPQRFSLR